MIVEETVNRLLRDTVDLILATPGYSIRAKQDAPRPPGAYADVDFLSDTSVGWEQHELEDNTGDLDITDTITGPREMMMSIGFYKDGAIDNCRKVRTAVTRESIQELFSQGGIALGRRSDVREISEPLESGWEERAQFDIVLNTTGSDSDIIRSIRSVDIGMVFESNGLSYNLNIEVQ